MSTFETAIELDVEVEFDYTPPCRGTRDRYGVPEEPDFDEEIEITKVTSGGIEITHLLTKNQVENLEEQAFQEIQPDE